MGKGERSRKTWNFYPYRYRVNILVASVSKVKFDVNGLLLEILGDRHHTPDHIRSRPGT